MIDLRSCLNPTVIGIKGRYFLESAELSFDNDKVKKADPYKLLGSSISIKLGFSSPLIRKIKLSETVKPVQDFVSKRYIPADVVYKQRSAQVAIEYKGKIKELINQLIGEYREAMRLESNLENSSKGLSQAQILSGEHMV